MPIIECDIDGIRAPPHNRGAAETHKQSARFLVRGESVPWGSDPSDNQLQSCLLPERHAAPSRSLGEAASEEVGEVLRRGVLGRDPAAVSRVRLEPGLDLDFGRQPRNQHLEMELATTPTIHWPPTRGLEHLDDDFFTARCRAPSRSCLGLVGSLEHGKRRMTSRREMGRPVIATF